MNHDDLTYVDSPSALHGVVEKFAGSDWIAVDTEFIRERTYYPQFCLLQLASSTHVACVDVLALDDLSPLDPLFDDEHTVKVFHAARQDLEILYRLRGRLPRPIFDTQVAAPFIGLPDQIGYSALAAELLDVAIAKTHSRTDWSIRPLAPAQLAYAADDVIHLGAIYQTLLARLQDQGRLDWVREETQFLSDPRLYDPPAEEAWLRIGGSAQLNARQVAALQLLATWREMQARQQDCPRNWVVKDEILVELARQQPKSLEELKLIRGLDDRLAKRFGSLLLRTVREAAALPLPAWQPRKRAADRDSPALEALLDVFSAVVRVRAAEQMINPSVLASRKELREFIEAPSAAKLLHGWRKPLVGDDLFAMLSGKKSLAVFEGTLRIIEHEP